jgi:hypothetical protein
LIKILFEFKSRYTFFFLKKKREKIVFILQRRNFINVVKRMGVESTMIRIVL